MGDRGDCAFLLCLLRLFETDGPEEAQMEVKFPFFDAKSCILPQGRSSRVWKTAQVFHSVRYAGSATEVPNGA